MSRKTRDGTTTEPVSLDQILRRERFPCSTDHKQDWQHYPVDPYSALSHDHTYINGTSSCAWLASPACGKLKREHTGLLSTRRLNLALSLSACLNTV